MLTKLPALLGVPGPPAGVTVCQPTWGSSGRRRTRPLAAAHLPLEAHTRGMGPGSLVSSQTQVSWGDAGRFTGPAARKGSHGCCSPLAPMKHPSCYIQGATEAQRPGAAHPRPHTSGGSELGGVPGPWPPGPGSVPLEVLVSLSPPTVPSIPSRVLRRHIHSSPAPLQPPGQGSGAGH